MFKVEQRHLDEVVNFLNSEPDHAVDWKVLIEYLMNFFLITQNNACEIVNKAIKDEVAMEKRDDRNFIGDIFLPETANEKQGK